MARNNFVFLRGNLTDAPFYALLEGRDGPVPFMRFTLAVDSARTDFIYVVAYGDRALHDHAFLRRGSEVAVQGRLRSRRVEGKVIYEVVADEVTFLRNIEWERGEKHWQEVLRQREEEGGDRS